MTQVTFSGTKITYTATGTSVSAVSPVDITLVASGAAVDGYDADSLMYTYAGGIPSPAGPSFMISPSYPAFYNGLLSDGAFLGVDTPVFVGEITWHDALMNPKTTTILRASLPDGSGILSDYLFYLEGDALPVFNTLGDAFVFENSIMGTSAASGTFGPGVDIPFTAFPGAQISENDTIYWDGFAAFIHGGSGDDAIFGGPDGDSIFGDAGNDEITGGGGNDVMNGGAGDDIFHKGTVTNDQETFNGGAGSDTVIFDTTGVTFPDDTRFEADLITGDGGVFGNPDNRDVFSSIENYTFIGPQAIYLTGNSADNRLESGDGDDDLRGERGNDYLIAGAGDDVLQGNSGDDFLFGGAGDDILFGGTGLDRLYGGAGRDVFFATPGSGLDIIYDYQLGVDRLVFAGTHFSDLTIQAYHATDTEILTPTGSRVVMRNVDFNALTGNDFFYIMNPMFGSGGNDYLRGSNADDFFGSHGGSDRMWGYGGNDIFEFDAPGGLDIVYDFSVGDDLISFSNGGYSDLTITTYGGTDAQIVSTMGGRMVLRNVAASDLTIDKFIFGGTDLSGRSGSVYNIFGTAGNDIVQGSAGADLISGGAGLDRLHGNGGDDAFSFEVGGGLDIVYDFELGQDMIALGAVDFSDLLISDYHGVDTEIKTLAGGRMVIRNLDYTQLGIEDFVFGADPYNITGTAGNDILEGSAGNDYFSGGAGLDRFYGNRGNDVFNFETGGGVDIVYDFEDGYFSPDGSFDLIRVEGQTFGDLTITAYGAHDTNITSAAGGRMVLRNVDFHDVTVDDFLFV